MFVTIPKVSIPKPIWDEIIDLLEEDPRAVGILEKLQNWERENN